MKKLLLGLLAVTSSCFSFPFPVCLQNQTYQRVNTYWDMFATLLQTYQTILAAGPSLDEINQMLHQQAPDLNESVIQKTMATLTCTNQYNINHNQILTIIDYSLPSNKKRLWIFDLQQRKLLFHTYVSHGLKSGSLLTTYFSNKYDSKASSIGVYKTEQAYYGRDGLSLKLDGLEKGFNDNAYNRSVVMHGGWYVEENFIKKYGRAGRSWGCPAVPLNLTSSIIQTIKNQSLFIVYYPNDNWLGKSIFLHCSSLSKTNATPIEGKPFINASEPRDEVLFAALHKKGNSEENEAVLTMRADHYQRIFHNPPPLTRMLRRQIEQNEYIALSQEEFKRVVNNDLSLADQHAREAIDLIVPQIKMVRGYNATLMKIVHLGKIKDIKENGTNNTLSYTIYFDSNAQLTLKPTNRFVRWLGL